MSASSNLPFVCHTTGTQSAEERHSSCGQVVHMPADHWLEAAKHAVEKSLLVAQPFQLIARNEARGRFMGTWTARGMLWMEHLLEVPAR